jgi:hypothetical protein
MNYWRSYLLISCILISGCTMGTGNRAHQSPAPASSGTSQIATHSTPQAAVPGARTSEVRENPVTNSQRVTFLSPRMQGIYHSNSNFENVGTPTPKAGIEQPRSPEVSVTDKTIAAQPSDSNTPARITGQQVLAADLLPLAEPHYVGPLAVVIIFVGLIYYALYRIAGSGGQMAQANPSPSDNRIRGENPAAAQGPGNGSRSDDARSSPGITAGSSGTEESATHPRETAVPVGNTPAAPRTDHQYESNLFGTAKTDSAGPSIVLQYDKDGNRLEKSESKTEFFGAAAQGAGGNPIKDFRPKE